MMNRFIKWIGLSVGLTILPIFISMGTKLIYGVDFALSNYNNELLFMAVMLSATSISDFTSIMQKGVSGPQITFLVVCLIFISLICICCYEILTIASISFAPLNDSPINVLTCVGLVSSLIIGGICQYFLEKVGA